MNDFHPKPYIHRVLLDWDGTLVADKTDILLPGAAEALIALRDAGITICVFTSSFRPYDIQRVMHRYGIVSYELVQHPPAEVLIDNRALRFEGDWVKTLEALETDACEPWDLERKQDPWGGLASNAHAEGAFHLKGGKLS